MRGTDSQVMASGISVGC